MPLRRLGRLWNRWSDLPRRIYRLQEAVGRIEARQTAGGEQPDKEFRVFSQWGEDGIIQYLLRRVPIERRIFIEFGVENYTEANTRFLLTQNAWAGLVIDGSPENVEFIKRDPIYWASNLKAEAAFITAENVNELFERAGIRGDIGLLSIDIDGNDYWVWNAIDSVSPRIVICEYNAHFGPRALVSTPYDPAFVRDRAHFSRIYYGASAAALESLAMRKGYSLVSGNTAGNNLFFVRDDVRGSVPVITASEAYRQPVFREYHDERGHLTFDDFPTRVRKIGHLPVFDLGTNSVHAIADALERAGETPSGR